MVDIDLIIASYLAGDATKEELETLREWIIESEKNAKYFQQRRQVWYATDQRRFNADKAFERFQRRIHKNSRVQWKRVLRYVGAGIAAAACIGLVIAYSFQRGRNSLVEPAQTAKFTVSAPAGSSTSLTLPDGTAVKLNSGSVLSYNQSFGMTERTLFLSGEAYFDVRHDEHLPLVVKVNGATVKDIGTKFNINAHDNNDVITVALVEGCSEVYNHLGTGRKVARLTENQIAEINRADGRMSVRRQSSLSPSEWINGALIFDNATLLTIANELSRRYSVNIVIASENLRSTRFYCYFVGKDFTLDDILKSLESTGKVKCRKENGLIRFQ